MLCLCVCVCVCEDVRRFARALSTSLPFREGLWERVCALLFWEGTIITIIIIFQILSLSIQWLFIVYVISSEIPRSLEHAHQMKSF